jgi:hypothetical protein
VAPDLLNTSCLGRNAKTRETEREITQEGTELVLLEETHS